MDNFFTQETCDRCYGPLTNGRTMSMYNEQCICMDCAKKERQRSDYNKAREADIRECKNGNYNFKGIGL